MEGGEDGRWEGSPADYGCHMLKSWRGTIRYWRVQYISGSAQLMCPQAKDYQGTMLRCVSDQGDLTESLQFLPEHMHITP
jgi:hypothetical protein